MKPFEPLPGASVSWRRMRIGVALGPEGLAAVRLGPFGRHDLRTMSAWALGSPGSPEYEKALDETLAGLRDSASGGQAGLRMALLRPLALTRSISLPPVRRRDRRPLIERSACRFFPLGDGPLIVDAELPGFGPARAQATVVHAASFSVVGEAIRAAESTGFEVETVVAGDEAAAAGFAAIRRSHRRGRWALALVSGESLHVLLLDGGKLRLCRSTCLALSPSASEKEKIGALLERIRDLVVETGAQGGLRPEAIAVSLAGAPAGEELVARWKALAPEGCVRLEPLALPPSVLAAYGTLHVAPGCPNLLPGARRTAARRKRHQRRIAWAGLGAGVLFCAALAGGAILDRLTEGVVERREILAPGVQEALRLKLSVEEVRTGKEVLESLVPPSGVWALVVAGIAETLPNDAYVLALREGRGSISLEVRGASAATVMSALAAAPVFSEVILAGPVRPEERASGLHRFTVELTPIVESVSGQVRTVW